MNEMRTDRAQFTFSITAPLPLRHARFVACDTPLPLAHGATGA